MTINQLAILIVNKIEGERIGGIMFLFKDTYGLTIQAIFKVQNEVLSSKKYKENFINLVHEVESKIFYHKNNGDLPNFKFQ